MLVTNTPQHSVSVAAVVTDDSGRVLVVQRRDNGAWQLPGGVLELEETIEAGVIREVQEETGILVRPVQLSGVYKNMKLGVVALVFRALPVDGSPHPTAESAAVEWWAPDRVAAEMGETFAARILDALSAHPVARIRNHDGVRFLDAGRM